MLSRMAQWFGWGSAPEAKKTVTAVATTNADINIGETNPNSKPDDVLPPEGGKIPDSPPSVPAGDHISMIEAELEADAKKYEDEINVWTEILKKRLEAVLEPKNVAEAVASLSFTQKIIDIFKHILDAFKKTKEALELPSTFISEKMAEADAHFDVIEKEVKALMERFNTVQCPFARKQILVDLGKKALDILYGEQILDVDTISEIKYVLMFRRAAEKIPAILNPEIAAIEKLLDEKTIDDLTRNEIYREINMPTELVKEHNAKAMALLNVMKTFVIKQAELLKPANSNGGANPHVLFPPAKPGAEVVIAPTATAEQAEVRRQRRLGQGS